MTGPNDAPPPTPDTAPEAAPPAATPSARAPADAERPSRARAIAAGLCLVLAALLTVPAGLAYWGQRTINDGQRYVDTVGPLVDSPEVQAAVATKVTEAIQKQVDVEAILNEVFTDVITDRPRLQALVGPLSGAINGLIDSQVREFIASDAFEDFWVAANTRAQARMVQLLKGEEAGALSIQGDEVVLDVSEVIDQVKQRLIARGLTIVERIPVPDVDKQIVLLEAPQLEQARTIYAFSNPIAQWLILVVAALYVVAYVLARNRPRMATAIGALVAANALLLGLALSVGEQLFVNHLSGTVFGPASRVFYEQLLSYLDRGQQVLLWLGLVLVLAGLFAGRSAPAVAARSTVAGGLESVGGQLAHGRTGRAGHWVAANAGWLRYAVGALSVVVLLWGNQVSMSRLLWAVVLVVVLLAVVQVLVGAGRGRRSVTLPG
ncbi:hypothetical protein [Nocardioides sediminis]|uniref:hypothetical protein n=1 Tax=Nocardioides sediminis TaxID=433648 RepID=UPI00131EF34A|nr:hypothetical protein [Nocardioides sediminis]